MRRAAALALLALTLGGCGLRGDLDRPPPLFGPARDRYEAQRQAEAEAAAAVEAAERAEEQGETPPETPPADPPPN